MQVSFDGVCDKNLAVHWLPAFVLNFCFLIRSQAAHTFEFNNTEYCFNYLSKISYECARLTKAAPSLLWYAAHLRFSCRLARLKQVTYSYDKAKELQVIYIAAFSDVLLITQGCFYWQVWQFTWSISKADSLANCYLFIWTCLWLLQVWASRFIDYWRRLGWYRA
jgi:hypothetical protein